jgi:hypothetical protein
MFQLSQVVFLFVSFVLYTHKESFKGDSNREKSVPQIIPLIIYEKIIVIIANQHYLLLSIETGPAGKRLPQSASE